jgi:N-acetylglucosaminyl-diphospho-decaprenol L-rhamnosyltransferase
LDALSRMAPSLTPVVVDNASSDRTVERVRARTEVRLIANRENRGFAAAVNQGAREAGQAGFLMLLNPDACLATPLDDLIEASRCHGLAAGKLAGQDGHAQKGFALRRFPTPAALVLELFGINRLWPGNPVNREYRYLDRDLDQPGPVEQPAGAFLMARRDAWERLGGLDEQFHPVWFEDVDFCRRAADAGYRIEYVPSAVALHAGGHSVGQVPRACRAMYWCDSLLRYAVKHFAPLAYRGVCVAAIVSAVPRMVAGIIQERSLAPVPMYFKIVKLASRRLVSFRRPAA